MADKPDGPVYGISGFQVWSTLAPTIKGWTFLTTAGPFNFHANREQLETIGNGLLAAARSLPSKSELS